MEIRDYMYSDCFECINLLGNCFPEILNVCRDLGKGLNSINKLTNKQLVSVISDKVVGYLLITKIYDPIINRYNFWIDYFCVDVAYRNMGIGRKLLLEVEKIARDENIYMISFSSSRFRCEARKLYQDMGYSIRESDIFRKVL